MLRLVVTRNRATDNRTVCLCLTGSTIGASLTWLTEFLALGALQLMIGAQMRAHAGD